MTEVTLKSTTMQKVLLVAALVIAGALQCAHGQSEYIALVYVHIDSCIHDFDLVYIFELDMHPRGNAIYISVSSPS